MFGYHKEKFGCFITNIEDNIVYADLCNDNKRFNMGILLEDLEKRKIKCKVGTIFTAIYKSSIWSHWAIFIFNPSKKLSYTKREIEEVRKYYEEKYGDV